MGCCGTCVMVSSLGEGGSDVEKNRAELTNSCTFPKIKNRSLTHKEAESVIWYIFIFSMSTS